jgi:hypothetical protein
MTHEPKPVPTLAARRTGRPHRLGNPQADKVYFNNLKQHYGSNWIDAIARQMAEILIAAGMPTETGVVTPVVYQTAHGEFTRGVRGLDELAKHRGHSIGSKVWNAAKIIEAIAEAREKADRELTDHRLVHLGILLERADIVFSEGHTFDRGLKNESATENAVKAAAEQKRAEAAQEHQRWIKAAQDIWERRPRLSRSACADMIIRDLDLSVTIQTVRKNNCAVQAKSW